MATQEELDLAHYLKKLELSVGKDIFWYWKKKARILQKFTGLDVLRIFTSHLDEGDRAFLKRFFLDDLDVQSLYGAGSNPPGTYAYTTWELLAKTMTWVGELWYDVALFLTEGEWPWQLVIKARNHKERFRALNGAWLAHYLRMYHKDEPYDTLEENYPFPPKLKEDPWWYV